MSFLHYKIEIQIVICFRESIFMSRAFTFWL